MRTVTVIPLLPLVSVVAATVASVACVAPSVPSPPDGSEGDGWSMNARLVESCCCDAICPCIVGSPPTRGFCHGNRLVEIVEGHHGGVDLAGVSLVITFNVGNWTKLYFDDGATQEQVDATVELLGKQRSFLFGELLEVERVPLTVQRTDRTIAFAVPAAATRVEVMRGFEDQPIEVTNLRTFRGYRQYRSLVVSHKAGDADQGFDYSGTNGFAATYSASGS